MGGFSENCKETGKSNRQRHRGILQLIDWNGLGANSVKMKGSEKKTSWERPFRLNYTIAHIVLRDENEWRKQM